MTIADKLDYERIPSYDLYVRATDIDTGSFAETFVHINLLVSHLLSTLTVKAQIQIEDLEHLPWVPDEV